MVKALERAFRSGRCWTRVRTRRSRTLAKAKDLAPSYASWVVRVTLLAPDIVEAIPGGVTAGGGATG